MKKYLRNTLCLALTACSVVGLTSCGLSSIEKKAKSYMKDHKDSYKGFNLGGAGLKYEADLPFQVLTLKANYKLNYDFSTSKGTCTASVNDTKVKFSFKCDYDYDNNNGTYSVTKVSEGKDSTAYTVINGLCETQMWTVYAIVAAAASLYDAQNSAK